MIKIYLAGPDVFYPNATVIGQAKKDICAKYGFEGVFPLDLLPDNLFSGKFSLKEQANIIKSACIKGIRECDILVANMTPFRGISMDGGTANEMGAAHIIGKKVYGYSLDSRSYLKKVQAYDDFYSSNGCHYDSFDQLIEDFDAIDNCMMTEECEFIVVENCIEQNSVENNLKVFEKTIQKIKESLKN